VNRAALLEARTQGARVARGHEVVDVLIALVQPPVGVPDGAIRGIPGPCPRGYVAPTALEVIAVDNRLEAFCLRYHHGTVELGLDEGIHLGLTAGEQLGTDRRAEVKGTNRDNGLCRLALDHEFGYRHHPTCGRRCALRRLRDADGTEAGALDGDGAGRGILRARDGRQLGPPFTAQSLDDRIPRGGNGSPTPPPVDRDAADINLPGKDNGEGVCELPVVRDPAGGAFAVAGAVRVAVDGQVWMVAVEAPAVAVLTLCDGHSALELREVHRECPRTGGDDQKKRDKGCG